MICATASIFAACNNGDKDLETKKDVITTDTSAMYRSNASTDTATVPVNNSAVNTVPPPTAPQTKTITRTRTVYVDRTPKTTTKNNVQKPAPNSQVNTVPQTSTNAGSAPASKTGTGNNTSVGTNPTTTSTPASRNKGWSNATKDAVIGGAAGAVGGAIISRKKGAGAVIGGVIGAAGGYILGRKKDKSKTDTIK